MGRLVVMDHPLIQHKVSLIRDKQTGTKDFRELVAEIAMLMAYEVTRDLPLKEVEIETPVAKAKTRVISGKTLGIVPILRAGLGMVDGILQLVPAAKVGHIGLYRDPETLKPVEYYCKLPADAAERDLIIVDPMLATGGSACGAITLIKERGCEEHQARLPHCGARGHRRRAEAPPRRGYIRRSGGRAAQRSRLHRSGPRGRGRQAFRNQVERNSYGAGSARRDKGRRRKRRWRRGVLRRLRPRKPSSWRSRKTRPTGSSGSRMQRRARRRSSRRRSRPPEANWRSGRQSGFAPAMHCVKARRTGWSARHRLA